MSLQNYLIYKFKIWNPAAPAVIDRTKGSITLRWDQLEPFGFLREDLLFKVEQYTKLPKWTLVYSGGRTTKKIENLAPRHPHRFRLKVILKANTVPHLADKAVAIFGKECTICEIFDKFENNIEINKGLIVDWNSTQINKEETEPKNTNQTSEITSTDNKKGTSDDLALETEKNSQNEKPRWLESLWSEEIWTNTETDGTSAVCFSMAVRCGYIKQVQGLLEERPDLIDIINSSTGFTPLTTAIRKGNISMVKFLVSSGADVSRAASSGQSPLHLAVLLGNIPLTQYLLEKGANFQDPDWNGLRAEHYAVDSCSLDMIQFVLDNGGDVTVTDNNGWTPLFRAVCQGARTEIIEELINRGSNVEAIDHAGLPLASVAKLLKNRLGHSRDSVLRLVDTNYPHEKALANFTRLTKKIHNVNSLLKLPNQ